MPEACAYLLFAGSRYGGTPEPPEYCENDALEGDEFCAEHGAEFVD